MSTQRPRVLCIDDNPLVVDAIRITVQRDGDLEWVGSRPSADDLPAAARDLQADAVLLDADMPGRNPFEALAELVRVAPQIRVIILSAHVRPDVIDAAIAAGAWGYVSKNDGEAALIDALRRVMAGHFCLSREVREVV